MGVAMIATGVGRVEVRRSLGARASRRSLRRREPQAMIQRHRQFCSPPALRLRPRWYMMDWGLHVVFILWSMCGGRSLCLTPWLRSVF